MRTRGSQRHQARVRCAHRGGGGVLACWRAGGMAGAEIEIDLDKLDASTLRHLDRFLPPLAHAR